MKTLKSNKTFSLIFRNKLVNMYALEDKALHWLLGLRPGRPVDNGPQEGDWTAWVAWEKGKVETRKTSQGALLSLSSTLPRQSSPPPVAHYLQGALAWGPPDPPVVLLAIHVCDQVFWWHPPSLSSYHICCSFKTCSPYVLSSAMLALSNKWIQSCQTIRHLIFPSVILHMDQQMFGLTGNVDAEVALENPEA